MDYSERIDSIDCPKDSGVAGLTRLFKSLLKEIPRIKKIVINSTGKVEYTWYAPTGAPDRALSVKFDDLLPYAVIRNSLLEEISVQGDSPVLAIAKLFMACHKNRLYPIALVTGAETKLWKWYEASIGAPVEASGTFCGYNVLKDREVPDDVLILCGTFARSDELTDTYCAYKITMEG